MKHQRGRRFLRYASSALCVVACILFIVQGVRSIWLRDSIDWRYSETGQFTFSSDDGTFRLGHLDARAWNQRETWSRSSTARDQDYENSASIAGFGWSYAGLAEYREVHIRYWVAVAFCGLFVAVPWMKWRYSLRTMLVAATVMAVMVGISAASHHREKERIRAARWPIKVRYDYGPFSDAIPAQFAAALEKGTEFELLSLHPMQYKATPQNNFHGYMVLGKTLVADDNVRKQLVAAFKGGINAVAGDEEEAPDCFDPRHGIRVKLDGKTIDFVICFECSQVYPFVDDKKYETFMTRESPQPEFDKVLTEAGVKLAPSDYD